MKKIFFSVVATMFAIMLNAQTTYSFSGLEATDFTNLVNVTPTTYTMDGVAGPALKYESGKTNMSVDVRGLKLMHDNASRKEADSLIVKTAKEFLQLDNKGGSIKVSGVTVGQTVTAYVSAKGKTNSVFTATGATVPTEAASVAKIDKAADYVALAFVATAEEVVISESAGGFRIAKIVVSDGDPNVKLPTVYDFAGLEKADFSEVQNLTETEYGDKKLYSFNYTEGGKEASFKVSGVTFKYKEEKAKDNIVKVDAAYIQLDGKGVSFILDDVKVGDAITLYVLAKGSSAAATFEATGATAPQEVSVAETGSAVATAKTITFTATATTVEFKETTGGFRLFKIEAIEGGEVVEPTKVTYTVTVPDGTKKVYIMGEATKDEYIQLAKQDDGSYKATINNATEEMTYNYYCGDSIAYVETAADGSAVAPRKYAEADVVAAWKEVPPVEYKYQTINKLMNFINVQDEDITASTALPFTMANGSIVKESTISSTASLWNIKDDYDTKLCIATKTNEAGKVDADPKTTADTVLVASAFRGSSGAVIELGEFEVNAAAEIEVYWQPNGTSARGVDIYSSQDSANVNVRDSVEFVKKEVCRVTKLAIDKGYYSAGEIVVKVVKNTINIFGVNITNLVPVTGLEDIKGIEPTKAVKVIEDGQIFIYKNGEKFNILGAKVE
ncbi:MAG: hypothetical protein IJ169_04250 [Paludibacteraceae bacterium]|nr:hypothetical protein [Paludibacteraceae bacterium]